MTVLMAIWARIGPYVLVVVAVGAVVLGLYSKGKRAGREAERIKGERKVAKARETRDDVETNNSHRSDDVIADRLRSWQRD